MHNHLPPPKKIATLQQRAAALAGLTLGDLAQQHNGITLPSDLSHNKGWIGQFIEYLLGASAHSLSEPDFPHLAIELKTLPLNKKNQPQETTYVCQVPLQTPQYLYYEQSCVAKKLQHVLWVPIEADRTIPLAQRRIATPFFWQATKEQADIIRNDWEELMEYICLGKVAQLTARYGQYLHIRPKAAHTRITTPSIGQQGESITTLPRGFYLRTQLTQQILIHQFQPNI